METGLWKFGPKLTLSGSYNKFSQLYLLSNSSKAPSLKPDAATKLQELQKVTGTSVDQRHVATELEFLVHQLSRDLSLVAFLQVAVAVFDPAIAPSKLRYCCKEIHYLQNTEETGTSSVEASQLLQLLP